MRYTASSGIEGSNPSRSGFSLQHKGFDCGVSSASGGLGSSIVALMPTLMPTDAKARIVNAMRKRSDGEGTVGSRPMPDGRWQARYTTIDAAGRVRRRAGDGTPRHEAAQKLRDATRNRDAGITPLPGRQT